MKIVVLVASFNRGVVTAKNLRVLVCALDRIEGVESSVILVDDASTDGTPELVKNAVPSVKVVEGTGDLYWNGGMCRAHMTQKSMGACHAYLLFNDDVEVFAAAVVDLVNEFRRIEAEDPDGAGACLVGSTVSKSGELTYSGYDLPSRLRPLRLSMISPGSTLLPVATFNANFVLISSVLFDGEFGLDPRFRHSLADIDLGLRLSRSARPALLYSRAVGTCERGGSMSQRVARLRRSERLKELLLGVDSVQQYILFYSKNTHALLFPFYVARVLLDAFWRAVR